MSELQRQDTLTKAVIAALGVQTTIVPTKDDDKDDLETIRGVSLESDPVLVDTSIFDVLTEFKLDLCLSPPSSPTGSVSMLPPSTPSPPLSPILSRSISFSSAKAVTVSKKSMKKKASKVSSTAPVRSRGSWPLMKYTGRGTPVDRRRRLEWSGFSTEDVAEDGMLFSSDVGDCTIPETPSIASSGSHSSHAQSVALMKTEPSIYEPPPELGPLEIESCSVRRSEEWDHIIKSVLATTSEEGLEIEVTDGSQKPGNTKTTVEEERRQDTIETHPLNFSIMSKEQVEELNSGLEAELGLNASLDLGFVQKAGSSSKWMGLDLLQLAGSSRASSPSVYSSQAVTLRRRSPGVGSDRSTKAEADSSGEANPEPKLLSTPWWKRMFGQLRRVHASLFTHF